VTLTAFVALARASRALWFGLAHWNVATTEAASVLDQLLLVLMLVEILHTVGISVRSHLLLAAEPFLVVGLIASIRRILVISLQLTALTKERAWSAEVASVFSAYMIEMSVLVVLTLVLVLCITLLRRTRPTQAEMLEGRDTIEL
jgi:uncharacterized membrane protein